MATRAESVRLLNKEVTRLFDLDEALSQTLSYRAFLEEIHRRDLPGASESTKKQMRVVTSAAVRALIAAAVAVVEPEDKRQDNRANVGQILKKIKRIDPDFLAREYSDPGFAIKLEDICRRHQECIDGDDYKQKRSIRNNALSHILDGVSQIKQVDYAALYRLHDAGKGFVSDLFALLRRGTPSYLAQEAPAREVAVAFWDTFTRGVRD